MTHPCMQESRLRDIEDAQQQLKDNQRDTTDGLARLSDSVDRMSTNFSFLTKVLLVIAAKAGVGLILVLVYMIKTFIIERGGN